MQEQRRWGRNVTGKLKSTHVGPRGGWPGGGTRPVAAAAALLFALMAMRAMTNASGAGATETADWELLAPLRVVQLDNGMTFLLYPNKRAPVFTGVIRFDVGGKDEIPGETGIAHMFEHMAFKGTDRIGTTNWEAEKQALTHVDEAAVAYDAERERLIDEGVESEALQEQLAPLKKALAEAQAEAARYVVKDEFDQIYQREGANGLNAYTSQDCTTYFVSLPSNRIELWAKMESERLSEPAMREFYSERDVVMEERRMRQDSSPVGQLWELTMATAFVAHPYQYPTIGWASDIRNLKAERAMDFFREAYRPDRAVGVLVGDLDVEKTTALLRETFGKIPVPPAAAFERRIVPEPEQRGERRAVLRLDATPTLLMAWHKPTIPDVDDARAAALMEVLAGGRSARWFEKFVKETRVAAEIEAFSGPGEAEPNLFIVYATPQGAATLDALEAAIREDVARLREEPIEADVLERAKKRLRANATRGLESNEGLAVQLAETAQIGGDPYYLERRLRQLEAVTPEDLRAFAEHYLTDENLTVGLLLPPEGGKD
jgi:predicted Zn-dependent peptidase